MKNKFVPIAMLVAAMIVAPLASAQARDGHGHHGVSYRHHDGGRFHRGVGNGLFLGALAGTAAAFALMPSYNYAPPPPPPVYVRPAPVYYTPVYPQRAPVVVYTAPQPTYTYIYR